ncbi:ABC transporter ATP-binding protein [Marmoricola sp. RAF53]|uniref:ABC transporter ATP-binding protein n=1 Tax=Marmoricola sp. RAF53 TaxID=3233059 RepID=UPI003F9C4528
MLDGVTFDLAPEETTALIGVNGAGKSTLLSVLSGCLRPQRGSVEVVGSSPYRRRERNEALRGVAFMPQTMTFPPNLTALEAVTYLAWMRGLSRSRAESRARDCLAQVRLEDREHDRLGALSGGMKRRVALAQALASEPEVLLLDEPSTGLDPEQRRQMVELLRGLRATTLVSSHLMEDVAEVAARVLVLDEGRLRYDGSISGLAAHAPDGTAPERAPEAGFLSILATTRVDR